MLQRYTDEYFKYLLVEGIRHFGLREDNTGMPATRADFHTRLRVLKGEGDKAVQKLLLFAYWLFRSRAYEWLMSMLELLYRKPVENSMLRDFASDLHYNLSGQNLVHMDHSALWGTLLALRNEVRAKWP